MKKGKRSKTEEIHPWGPRKKTGRSEEIWKEYDTAERRHTVSGPGTPPSPTQDQNRPREGVTNGRRPQVLALFGRNGEVVPPKAGLAREYKGNKKEEKAKRQGESWH